MHEKFEAYGNFSLVPKMDLNSKGFYLSLNRIGEKTNKDFINWGSICDVIQIYYMLNVFAELNLSFLDINSALKIFGSNFGS